jgi:hypothetical protein
MQRDVQSWWNVLLHAGLTVLLQAGIGAIMAINGIVLAGIAMWYPAACAAFVALVLVILYAVGVISFPRSRRDRTPAGSGSPKGLARRKFSRWMPPSVSKPLRWWEQAIFLPFVVMLYAVVIVYLVLLAPLHLFLSIREKRLAAARTAERKGEDIGTFAQSFDRRSKHFDQWVIRGTWDALMFYVDFPIRASDRINDLGIDPEDFFLCVIPEIIERSGRTADGKQPDTHPGRETVGDLVLFISSLKRIEDAQPPDEVGLDRQPAN